MRRRYLLLAVPVVVALAWTQIAVTDGDEAEEAVAFDQLPAAVQKAVQKAYPGAEVTKCVKETEEGKTLYEVELESGKLEAELELDATGKVLETETEEEIALDQLPEAVRDAAQKLVKGGELLEAERIVEGGKTTYEVEVQCGAVILELGMNRSGNVLSIEVEDEDDDAEGDDAEDDDGDDDEDDDAEDDDTEDDDD
jgi:uncharacterized membrane protein YkoI